MRRGRSSLSKLRGEVREAFERELWSAEKGVYRDGKAFQTSVKPSKWLPADVEMESFSTQVNALAVLYGLAPAERRAEIMQRVMERGDLNCQPYFMHFVFDALAAAGTEMWEKGDWSHGWVATPVIQMAERILGVSGGAEGVIEIRRCVI